MRKVSFALAHCFQTCLISPACCSTCLFIFLVTMPNNMPSKEEEILISNMKKQIQLMSTQLQRMKEEDETSSNKFSLRDYFPSYNVESKPSQNNLQTPKKFRNIFEEKPWEPKPNRDFTPLGRSYESTLEELLQKKLIVLPQKQSGFFFLSSLLFLVCEQSCTTTLCFTKSLYLAL